MAIVGDAPTLESVVASISSSNTGMYAQMYAMQQNLVSSIYNNPYYNSTQILGAFGPTDSVGLMKLIRNMNMSLSFLNPSYKPIHP